MEATTNLKYFSVSEQKNTSTKPLYLMLHWQVLAILQNPKVKGRFEWPQDCQEALDQVEFYLSSTPYLPNHC